MKAIISIAEFDLRSRLIRTGQASDFRN